MLGKLHVQVQQFLICNNCKHFMLGKDILEIKYKHNVQTEYNFTMNYVGIIYSVI